jgi:hypothetical protein
MARHMQEKIELGCLDTILNHLNQQEVQRGEWSSKTEQNGHMYIEIHS